MIKNGFRAWQACAVILCLFGLGLTILSWMVWPFVSAALKNGGNFEFLFDTEPEDGGPRFKLQRSVELNGKELKIEFASTPAEIERGLSDRLSMQPDEGMLFVFSEPARISFWMNRMRFPLDIIWIRNGSVVDIASDMPIPADTYGIPKSYTPAGATDLVLELTAGGVERYGLAIGSDVSVISDMVKAVLD